MINCLPHEFPGQHIYLGQGENKLSSLHVAKIIINKDIIEKVNLSKKVVQHRGNFGLPQENFTRGWEDYRTGFGDMDREFWWGNELLSRLTLEGPAMELRVLLEAHDGRMAVAEYSTFRVEGEETEFRLWVDGFSGNASDSFSAHSSYKFSTVDRNNDEAPKCCPCAPAYGGGWWFYR